MAKDFSGQDCRGRSFKNQDLTAATFCRARMGRTRKMTFVVLGLQGLLSELADSLALFGNALVYILRVLQKTH